MTLKDHIAAALKKEPVGLLLRELADRIPPDAYENNRDKISQALFFMAKNIHVTKNSGNPARWSITPQGRAAYSVLNDDAPEDIRGTTNRLLSDAMAAPAVIDETDNSILVFDTEEPLDRALYGLVKLIREVANQEQQALTIENKQAAIDLLETMESNPIISGPHRATFARIRSAVAQMEDAA